MLPRATPSSPAPDMNRRAPCRRPPCALDKHVVADANSVARTLPRQPQPAIQGQPPPPRKLKPLSDPDLPPVPERPVLRTKFPLCVVAWEVALAGDGLHDDILGIGAFCPAITASSGAVGGHGDSQPPGAPGTSFHVDMVPPDGNADKRYNASALAERRGLEQLLGWLTAASTAAGGHGVLLLSHAGVPAKLPRVLLAMRRRRMSEPVFKVVRGFCDFNSRLLRGDANPLPLSDLSRDVLGEEVPAGLPVAQVAALVYRLLCEYFKCETLSPSLPPLPRLSFSSECMASFAQWRQRTDHRLADMRAIVTSSKVGRGVKRKRALLKNLVSLGYNYQRLGRDLDAMGEYSFRAVLANKLKHMKRHRESALTETRDVGCTTVLEAVLNHFREVGKDRQLRRLPPLAPLAPPLP